MIRPVTLLFAVVLLFASFPAAAQGTRLLRQPTVSAEHIAFVHGGDIWITSREGGPAHRITTSEGEETYPYFSPDGSQIAFTGEYDGNTDVYVVPTSGGNPKRLTHHPAADYVRGWTPDGTQVLFASGRDNPPRGVSQLWTISVDGGMPQRLPFPMASHGVWSPDARRMAYVPLMPAYNAWKHYRGGRTTGIWIVDMNNLGVEEVPRGNSNDYFPMWIGDTLYFVSDHHGVMNLYAYEPGGGGPRQLTNHADYDIKHAHANGGVIVYEQAGYIHRFDPELEESAQLTIHARGDLPWTRPQFKSVHQMIRSASISPSGRRAVFEARGDIFTVPAEKGDTRAITATPNVHDRFPAWSPDGKHLAWFSDASGEYQLMIAGQSGLEEPRRITLGNPSFYYNPAWSPDSTKILFTDKHLTIWYVEVETGQAVKVATGLYSNPQRSLNPVWSPDSKWIAYARRLDNQFRAIFVYSLESGEYHQITDGLSDANSPAFDRNGKYLYFLASTNYSRSIGWLDMTSYDTPVTRAIYFAVLDKDEPSPLLPESDEEEIENGENENEAQDTDETGEEEPAADNDDETPSATDIVIHLENIGQRILALDLPERNYTELKAGPENTIFYTESVPNESGLQLHKYNLKEKERTAFLKGVQAFDISADGKKLLYAAPGNTYGIVGTDKAASIGDGKLDTSGMQVRVDPRAEWAQIYDEAWRIKRDFFYDEKMHGADWPAMREKYRPLLEHVAHRSDLTHLLEMLLSETVSGHTRTGGGDSPAIERVPVGMLGADYELVNGAFRIARIYEGENWNPGLRAPLSAPGIDVNAGDYILAVNGRPVEGPNLYAAFEGTAGKQTVLTLATDPAGADARTVTVVPIADESNLRMRTWMESNRQKVDELSGGKLAYVFLPNTAAQGYTNFNRYYYGQQHKDGVIVDERFNGGGSVADYMVDFMDRPLLSYWATRDGREFTSPNAAIFGPKVMIINEYAGSGGDFLPFAFRKRGLGPLIGKRTWGGLIGVYDYPILIDGGSVTAPRLAIYSEDGEWIVENVGVPPDIEVEQTPAAFTEGRDPQLERAVEVALELLSQQPRQWTDRPPPIDRTWK